MGFQASPIFKLRVKLRAISDPLEDVSVSKNEIFLVSFNLPIDELEVFSPPGTLSTTTYSFIFTPIFVSSSVEMFVFYLSLIYIYI